MRWLLTINKKNMVNIDTVYQRVLAIANKEQRGYITPQEFNLLANQAQMEVFEQYFYDKDQFRRKPGNDTTHADMIDLLKEKIDIFEKFRVDVTMSSGGVGELPAHYRMGELYYLCNGNYVEVEKIDQNQLHHYMRSPLTTPTINRPIYVRTSGTTAVARERAIQVYPTTITSGVTCNHIARPSTVEWVGTIVLDELLYNANSSIDFELHQSEESNLVLKILELAGVIIKQQDVYSIASQEEVEQLQQEKI
tara:strand:+ start:77 stop:829 length:753 start_codon:yes stop_codon:yes gene_type:complete